MQIIFLKDHLAHKQGDLIETGDESGNYLIRVGVAKLYEPEPEKKEAKTKREKKEIIKPGAE